MKVLFPAFLSIQGPYLSYTEKGSEGLEGLHFLFAVLSALETTAARSCTWYYMVDNREDLNREKEVWKYCVILTPNESSDTETLGSSVRHTLFIKMASAQGLIQKVSNWYWFLWHKIATNCLIYM